MEVTHIMRGLEPDAVEAVFAAVEGASMGRDEHPLGCHRVRVPDRLCFWGLFVRLKRCGDADVVDQALQDTFLAVWRKPVAYRGTGAVAAWLWGIAVRRLIDQLRRRPALKPADAEQGADRQAHPVAASATPAITTTSPTT